MYGRPSLKRDSMQSHISSERDSMSSCGGGETSRVGAQRHWAAELEGRVGSVRRETAYGLVGCEAGGALPGRAARVRGRFERVGGRSAGGRSTESKNSRGRKVDATATSSSWRISCAAHASAAVKNQSVPHWHPPAHAHRSHVNCGGLLPSPPPRPAPSRPVPPIPPATQLLHTCRIGISVGATATGSGSGSSSITGRPSLSICVSVAGARPFALGE